MRDFSFAIMFTTKFKNTFLIYLYFHTFTKMFSNLSTAYLMYMFVVKDEICIIFILFICSFSFFVQILDLLSVTFHLFSNILNLILSLFCIFFLLSILYTTNYMLVAFFPLMHSIENCHFYCQTFLKCNVLFQTFQETIAFSFGENLIIPKQQTT